MNKFDLLKIYKEVQNKINPFSKTETRGGGRAHIPYNKNYEKRSRKRAKEELHIKQLSTPQWLHEELIEIKSQLSSDYSINDLFNIAAYLIFVDSEFTEEKKILLDSVKEALRRERRNRQGK